MKPKNNTGYILPVMMNERLLHYIWQFQCFNKKQLILDNGEPFQVIHPGRYNPHKGPAFLQAKIKFEDALWVGHIEVHLKTSDYGFVKKPDRIFEEVVLHVVWENDQPDIESKKPILSLQPRILPIQLLEIENQMRKELSMKTEITIENIFSDINTPYAKNIENYGAPPAIKAKKQKNYAIKKQKNNKKEIKPEYLPAKKKMPGSDILKGEVRNIKIHPFNQPRKLNKNEQGNHFITVPKILLSGNWLIEAGFECNKRVQVFSMKHMLIIIPEVQQHGTPTDISSTEA